MANFVALTPPLGQQPLGAFGPFQSAIFNQPQGIPLTFGSNDLEINYPPLSAPIRVLLLKKYPGTILPDSDLEDVIPGPVLDPIHVQEIWQKFDDTTCDHHIYNDIPTNDLDTFIEREIAEWITDYNVATGCRFLIVIDRPLTKAFMESNLSQSTREVGSRASAAIKGSGSKSKSKKRARGDAFKDDAVVEKFDSRSPKQSKKRLSSTVAAHNTPSMKNLYDAAFPADVVVDQDSPAYIMAFNYLKEYAKSSARYSGQVSRIIEKQGMDPLAQRCAKFFAWGLKQAIHSIKVELAEPVSKPESQPNSDSDSEPEPEPVAAKAIVESESDDEDVENSDFEELDLGGDSDDEIINVRPLNKKPVIQKFETSTLCERLGSFLPALKIANEKLKGQDASIEASDSDSEHIEMNLGLGVLEEVGGEGTDELMTERPR